MNKNYEAGYIAALRHLGINKVAAPSVGLAARAGRGTLNRLKSMFGGSGRAPGMQPASKPPSTFPPGMTSAPKFQGTGSASPPPAPSQWVPRGATKPRPAASTPQPSKETTMLGRPGASESAAAETAFGGPGQPGRASKLLQRAKGMALPAAVVGGAGLGVSQMPEGDPGGLPVQRPYMSESPYGGYQPGYY